MQALEAMRVALPDVVVLDLLLPGRLGWDLMPLLREQDPGLPVIAMTAASSPDVEHAARAHGAFGYILKPPSNYGSSLLTEDSMTSAALEAVISACR